MEACHECKRELAADLSEAVVLCAGGCRRLFHARCTSLDAEAEVSAYLRHERRWKCADCQEKCAACSDSIACGAFAGVVACAAGCGRLYHAECTELAAIADLRQYLSDRRQWICDGCREPHKPHKSESTRRPTAIEPSAEEEEEEERVERADVEAICRSMLEVEKCLEQFSRKLELFEKDVMSVNGCVKAASQEICKSNAENRQVGEKIEQLTTEVERAAAAVPAADLEVKESPAETKVDLGEKAPPTKQTVPKVVARTEAGEKDAPAKETVPKVAARREKSLSLGGRRRNGHDPRSERVPVLYKMTKQFARENDYRLVWIHHADVFLRKRPGSSAKKVKHKDDLRTEDTPVIAAATQVK